MLCILTFGALGVESHPRGGHAPGNKHLPQEENNQHQGAEVRALVHLGSHMQHYGRQADGTRITSISSFPVSSNRSYIVHIYL